MKRATWRKEPCPAELHVGADNGRIFPCEKVQTWKGPLELPHHHRWDGHIDNQHVTVIWRDEEGS